MAHFNLKFLNSRGKQVSASDPAEIRVNGWTAGVTVLPAAQDAGDVFLVYMTSGSGGAGIRTLIGSVRATEDGPEWLPNERERDG